MEGNYLTTIYFNHPVRLRSANRFGYVPAVRYFTLGVRLARALYKAKSERFHLNIKQAKRLNHVHH